MYNTALVIIGFVMVFGLIGVLLSGKTIPAVAFILISLTGALVAGLTGNLAIPEGSSLISVIKGYVTTGVGTVTSSVGMAAFGTAFFTVQTSKGTFDPIVSFLSKFTKNVMIVMLITYLVATVGHVDTGTTSTILLTIPMMLPIYRKMHIKVEYMFLCIGSAVAVMNMLPMAGGPIGLSATTGTDIGLIFQNIVPSMIVGFLVNIVLIVLLYSKTEQRRINNMTQEEIDEMDAEYSALLDGGNAKKGAELQNVTLDWKYYANLITTIVALVFVFLDKLPAYFVFMVAFSIALLINYPTNKDKQNALKMCAPNCYPIIAIMLCAGVFVGVTRESGMLTDMATFVVTLIPQTLHGIYNAVIGLICVPMSIALGSQAYYYGFCGLLVEVASKIGVPAISTITTLIITQNAFGFITPVSAVNHLACGMLGRDIKDVIKFCFPRLFLYLVIQLAICFLLGMPVIGG
ncbi:MAG: hypothetical protein IKG34_01470 [Solobacterium sp.]|nr:hypothetical protein [Solobacterium sp.]